jgi:protocatechuate 3,4-dioxygenase beta subunit
MKTNLLLFVLVWVTNWCYAQSGEWIHYDDGTNYSASAYGTNVSNYDIAIKYAPEDIQGLRVTAVHSVKVYNVVSASPPPQKATVKIWQGTDAANEVASVDYTPVDGWNVVELAGAYTVDNTQELWIGVRYKVQSPYHNVARFDAKLDNPGKGNLMRSVNGDTYGDWIPNHEWGDWNIQFYATVFQVYNVAVSVVEEKEGHLLPVTDAVVSIDKQLNPQGVYAFDNLPAGEHKYIVSKNGYATESGTFTLPLASPLSITLSEGESLRHPVAFTVVDKNSRAITGATVTVNGITLNPNVYSTTLEAGIYEYRIEKPGFTNAAGKIVHIAGGTSETVHLSEAGDVLIKATVNDSENALFYWNGSVYTANWTENTGLLHVYTPSGTGLIPAGTVTVSGLPDNAGHNFYGFASDGTFIYAVNQSPFIFVINPATLSVVNSIEIDHYTVLGSGPVTVAYDAGLDGFWCSFLYDTQVVFIEKNGATTNRGLTGPAQIIMGLAYDDTSDGGPYLWASTGGASANNYAKIGRWNIYTGEYTEEIKNVPQIMGVPTGANYMGSIYLTQDVSSGKQLLLGVLPSQRTLFGYDLGNTFPVLSPDRVSRFSCTPGTVGALTARLTWKNPERNLNGTALSPLNRINIYRNNQLIHTVSSPVAGAEQNWTDNTVVSPDIYRYKITAENGEGEGVSSVRTVFAGEDIPGAVSNLHVVEKNKNAAIVWSAPVKGENSGWIDPAALTYRVIRRPDNVVLADNITETSLEDNTVAFLNMYSYTVSAKNGRGEGKPLTSNAVLLGSSIAVPWLETFGNQETLPLWKIVNSNGDYNTWSYNPYNGGGSMQCASPDGNDDWLISPPVSLESGKKYHLRWNSASVSNLSARYELATGRDTTVASLTVLASYSVNAFEFTSNVREITVQESGIYHFAWHSIDETEEIRGSAINAISLEAASNIDLSAIAISGVTELQEGEEGTFTVRVKNRGLSPVSSYLVDLLICNENGSIDKRTVSSSEALSPEAEKDFAISWMPSATGNFTLKGAVTTAGDANIPNDTTYAHPLKVHPAGVVRVYIGNPASGEYSQLSPFNCYFEHNVAQSLYYEEEINRNGLITAIEYYYSFEPGNPVHNKPVQIYMAITKEDDLREGWITQDMILVYDGMLHLPDDRTSVTIPLREPVVYSGGNLVIHTQGDDTKSYHPFNQFLQTGSDRVRLRAFADRFAAFDFTQTGHILRSVTNISLIMDEKGGSLSGTVTDNNQQPVENASILIEGKPWKTVTDAAGRYRFDFLPAETPYTLSVSKAGYSSQTKTEVMPTNDCVSDFVLSACTSQPVKNLTETLHSPQWSNVQLTWEAPDGISSENYVTAYRVYVNSLLKATLPAHTLSWLDSAPWGNCTCEVSAVWNNGCESPSLSRNIEMKPETVITEYPFFEGFESGEVPAAWEEKHIENDRNWAVVQEKTDNSRSFTPHAGQYFASLSDDDHYLTTTRLTTPMLDLHSVSQPYLSFWHIQSVWGNDRDKLAVYYKNAPDGKWLKLAEYDEDVESWKREVIQLPAPESTYWIGFEGISLFGYGVMLDDITVSDGLADGIVLPDSESKIRIYPNPVHTEVTIVGESLKRIEICNVLGKMLDSIVVNGQQQQIDMQAYEAGIYLLKIVVSEDQIITRKIVKN